MTILVGTSGFSYKDWVGPVYPEGLPKQEWLAFYAKEFPTCELNFSTYRIPEARNLTRMADKVPEGFPFAIKAYRGIDYLKRAGAARTPYEGVHGGAGPADRDGERRI